MQKKEKNNSTGRKRENIVDEILERVHNREKREGKRPKEELEPREDRLESRRKDRKKRRVRALIVLIIIILLLAAAVALIYIDKKGYVNVDTINVDGNSHYTSNYIIKKSGVTTDTGIITLSKKKAVSALEDLPYVKSARVSKKLPHTVNISVTERVPAYAAYFGGYYVYLDEDMIMLQKSNDPGDLLVFEGFVPERLVLGEEFIPVDSENFEKAKSLAEDITASGCPVSKISYENDNVSVYLTKTIACQGDPEDIVKYADNLASTVNQLTADGIERGTLILSGDGNFTFSPKI